MLERVLEPSRNDLAKTLPFDRETLRPSLGNFEGVARWLCSECFEVDVGGGAEGGE